MEVDVGNIGLALQIAILFLLILGLPLVKGRDSKRNVTRHGYLTALALALHTVLIIIVMIPSFSTNFEAIVELSLLQQFNVWSHVILGTTAEVLGFILVGFWMFKSPSKVTCAKRKNWMMPTFVIWTLSLIGGALVHILEMV